MSRGKIKSKNQYAENSSFFLLFTLKGWGWRVSPTTHLSWGGSRTLPIITAINFLWWGHCTSSPYGILIQRLWFCHFYFHNVYPRIGYSTRCESRHPSQSGRLRLRFTYMHLLCSRCEAVSWRWLFWRLQNSFDWICSTTDPEYWLKVIPESTFFLCFVDFDLTIFAFATAIAIFTDNFIDRCQFPNRRLRSFFDLTLPIQETFGDNGSAIRTVDFLVGSIRLMNSRVFDVRLDEDNTTSPTKFSPTFSSSFSLIFLIIF